MRRQKHSAKRDGTLEQISTGSSLDSAFPGCVPLGKLFSPSERPFPWQCELRRGKMRTVSCVEGDQVLRLEPKLTGCSSRLPA